MTASLPSYTLTIHHSLITLKFDATQSAPGGKVIVSVVLSKKVYMYICPIPSGFRDRYSAHCTDEQHAMSSQELQIALMLTVEFSKMYYTR
jgi:hypothetical protein